MTTTPVEFPGAARASHAARLLLYTDEPVLAKGVEAVLAEHSEFVFAVASQDAGLLAAAMEDGDRGILLIDWKPPLSIAEVPALRAQLGDVKVVLWTDSDARDMVSQALQSGVCGVLQRAIAPETLLRCLHTVAEGGVWFDQNLVAGYLQASPVHLTGRETELLDLLSQGLKNKEIAYELGITEGSVKVYLSRIFKKMGVSDRFEAALQVLNQRGGRPGVRAASAVLAGDHSPVRAITPARVHSFSQERRA